MASFLKQMRQARSTGVAPLSFNRAHIDGMPFYGRTPLLREEEFDEFTEVVQNGNVEVFDLSDPEAKAALAEIIDCATNGWYNIYRLQERFVDQADGTVKVFVYCIWSSPHKEIAKHRLPAGIGGNPFTEGTP